MARARHLPFERRTRDPAGLLDRRRLRAAPDGRRDRRPPGLPRADARERGLRPAALFFSQRVLLALVEHGMPRDEAYAIVQRAAARALGRGSALPRGGMGGGRADRRDHEGRRSGRCSRWDRSTRTWTGCSPGWRSWRYRRDDAVSLAERDASPQGKVRDLYPRRATTCCMVAIRPDLRVRRGAAHAHPGEGPGAVRPVAALVRPDRGPRAEPPAHGRRRTPSRRRSAAPSGTRRAGPCWSSRAEVVPVECVARGYITGSGWKDYRRTARVCGIALPEGLVEVAAPARADLHAHDEGRHRP